MLNIFKSKPQGEQITFKVTGMHCVSCGMNIDGELEDTAGVMSATTNYTKGQTVVVYDPAKVKPVQLQKVIESLQYEACEI